MTVHLLDPGAPDKTMCGEPGSVTFHLAGLTCEDCREAGYEWTKREAFLTGSPRCREGEAVFFYADTRAREAGHIYSDAGSREFWISGYCEFHFDLITAEPEEDDLDQPS